MSCAQVDVLTEKRWCLLCRRQLLGGAAAGELQGTHEVLQRALQGAPGRAPAAALPALEASLLALETAEGRALASQVRSILVVVP